ncbi:disks large homolog 5-like isoform X2 [Peromyscus maniculatus bairdii]|uniref:disks large homolog 5-like isoform X2 n=2 Tax=Peromyscus maniculatus bairdii TaxID=230844 RepID=UPI003FCEF879
MLARLSRLLGRRKAEHNETRERRKEAGLHSQCHTSRNKWFWGKRRTTRKASTPTSLTEQEQQMNKVDRLTCQLQMMTNERNELSIILANFTNNDLNNRLNFELEMLNMEHKKVMVDLEKFPNEISEALNKCKELTEETVSCSILHSQLLSERTHLKEKVSILREKNRKLRGEQISLQESCEEMRRLCGEAHEKIYDLWAKEKQKQERLEERLQYLLKQRDLVTKHKVLAEKLQHYFTVSQMSTT